MKNTLLKLSRQTSIKNVPAKIQKNIFAPIPATSNTVAIIAIAKYKRNHFFINLMQGKNEKYGETSNLKGVFTLKELCDEVDGRLTQAQIKQLIHCHLPAAKIIKIQGEVRRFAQLDENMQIIPDTIRTKTRKINAYDFSLCN